MKEKIMPKNVNKITKYQTSDMREFEDRDNAIQWEVQMEIAKILGLDMKDLLIENIIETIVSNKDAIIAALKDL